ncbi:MAG: hypothetical protein WCK13_02530 [Ignavibacteriota bacterium]|nr:hypothetical protein [Ignavibacteriota bacterium]
MKRFALYSLVLLTAIGIVFISMRFVSSKDISGKYTGKDTIQQGCSKTEVTPNSTDKCGKCCCKKSCDKSSKEEKKDEEVPIGKNPNLNNPDTTKSNITPQEVKQ